MQTDITPEDSWAPYMTWMKRVPPIAYNLMGSNLLHCEVEDLPGARDQLALDGPHEEGYEPLLEAIADRYSVGSDAVAVATGASGANFLACGALLRPGEEVLVERPAYDPLLGVPRFLGATVRRFDRVYEEGFRVNPERVASAITPKTRLVILSNLHNPTGAMASAEDLARVGEVADRVGARVLVDEVYLESVETPAMRTAATLSPTFISTSSLTKSYGLSGLRAGWALADPELTEKMRRVRDIVDAVGSFPSEVLALLAFRNLPALHRRAQSILGPNFDRLQTFVDARSELEWVPPVGGSVGFPRIRGVGDSSPFVRALRERFDTGVVPGRFFEAPAHFRIALGGRADVLEEGLERLAQALDEKVHLEMESD
jgi:aspartate/methionine/tyrosine aminotransferase